MTLAIKRAIASAESSSYWKGDTEDVFTDAKLKKQYKMVVDWDLIKAQTGEAKTSGNSDAKEEPAPVVLAYMLGGGARLTYTLKAAIAKVLCDELGREAFQEAFDAVVVRVKVAPASSVLATKEGKTLVFNVEAKLSDWMNVSRSVENSKLASSIEDML